MQSELYQNEAMRNYFIVVELPGGEELKFINDKNSPTDFWINAAQAVISGTATVIIIREDTGVCEEFWKYNSTLIKFTTFILVNVCLCPDGIVSQQVIYNKFIANTGLIHHELVIDKADNFQLVTIDCQYNN